MPALATTARLTKAVDAGVVSVCDQGWVVQPSSRTEADLGGDLVADESDRARRRDDGEVVERSRVDQAVDGFECRDAGADEDRRDDEIPGALLGQERAQQKRDSERDRRERVSEVVDQVGEQGHAAGREEDRALRERGRKQHGQAGQDRAKPVARARDRTVDQAVTVTVTTLCVIVAVMGRGQDARLGEWSAFRASSVRCSTWKIA